MVSDPHWPGAWHPARVAATTIDDEKSLVYHYQDASGHHVVELSTLRYFKIRERTPAHASL